MWQTASKLNSEHNYKFRMDTLQIKLIAKKLEPWLIIFLLLFSAGAWIGHPQPLDGVDTTVPGASLRSAIRLATYGIFLLLINRKWQRFAYVITRDKALLLLIGIALFSFLWSDDPARTVENGKGLLRMAIFGTYLAMRYSWQEQLRLLAGTGGIAALLSVAYYLVSPADALHTGAAFRGIFFHKNEFAEMMALGGVACLLTALNSRKYHRIMWIGFGICTIFLILSSAKAPLLSFLTILSFLLLRKTLQQVSYAMQVVLVALIMLIGGFLTVLLVDNLETALVFIGKDATFNGRTDPWVAGIKSILIQPWLGYGYYGFWSNQDNKHYFNTQLPPHAWVPGHSHNGFIELGLSLGLIGLLLFMCSWVRAVLKAINQAFQSKRVEHIWSLQFLIFVAIVSLVGGVVLEAGSFSWTLYIATVLSLDLKQNKAVNSTNELPNKSDLQLVNRLKQGFGDS
jgi:O-antigen ligase